MNLVIKELIELSIKSQCTTIIVFSNVSIANFCFRFQMVDVRIHCADTVINLRYGTTLEHEKQRLLHHAKTSVMRKAWHRERDLLRLGLPTNKDWSVAEIEEILKSGYTNGFDGEYIRDTERYPELCDDPYNIRFVKTN